MSSQLKPLFPSVQPQNKVLLRYYKHVKTDLKTNSIGKNMLRSLKNLERFKPRKVTISMDKKSVETKRLSSYSTKIFKTLSRHIIGFSANFIKTYQAKYFSNLKYFNCNIIERSNLKNLKWFKSLKALAVSFDSFYRLSDNLRRVVSVFLERFFKRCSKNLKFISLEDNNIWSEALNSATSIQSNLHNLPKLEFVNIKKGLLTADDAAFLDRLPRFKEMVTSLELTETRSKAHVTPLAKNPFQNLQKLSFIAYTNLCSNFVPTETLRDIASLKTLNVTIDGLHNKSIKNFLSGFQLPSRISELSLGLKNVDFETSCAAAKSQDLSVIQDPFENDESCMNFFNSCRQLSGLKALHINYLSGLNDSVLPVFRESDTFFYKNLASCFESLDSLKIQTNIYSSAKKVTEAFRLDCFFDSPNNFWSNLKNFELSTFNIEADACLDDLQPFSMMDTFKIATIKHFNYNPHLSKFFQKIPMSQRPNLHIKNEMLKDQDSITGRFKSFESAGTPKMSYVNYVCQVLVPELSIIDQIFELTDSVEAGEFFVIFPEWKPGQLLANRFDECKRRFKKKVMVNNSLTNFKISWKQNGRF